MARTVRIDGVSVASKIRLDTLTMTMCANRGEIGIGGFDFDDPASASDVAAWKDFTVNESDESEPRMYTGYTGVRTIRRADSMQVGTDRRFGVEIVDLNCLFDESIIKSKDGQRDSETDYARITWLASHVSLTSYTNVVINPNSNKVTMEATDYRGKHPRDVLDDCAEASGKTYFLLYDVTNLYTLFYDLSSSTSLTSTFRISDDPADQDGFTKYPIAPQRVLDPSNVYSGLQLNFEGGDVYLTDASVATAFKKREAEVQDSGTHTFDGATARAQQFLDVSGYETETLSCSVLLDSTESNRFPAGYRFQVKFKGLGRTTFTYQRISRCTLVPAPGRDGVAVDKYIAHLEFTPKIKSTRLSGRGVPVRKPDSELVLNGGFEFGHAGDDNRINDWSVTAGTARPYNATTALPRPHGGHRALRVEQDVTAQILTFDYAPVQGYRHYLLRGYWMWNVGSAPSAPQLNIYWYDSEKVLVSSVYVAQWTATTTGKWSRVAFYTRAPIDAAYRRIRIYSPAGTAGRFSYFDDISFELTSAALTDAIPPD